MGGWGSEKKYSREIESRVKARPERETYSAFEVINWKEMYLKEMYSFYSRLTTLIAVCVDLVQCRAFTFLSCRRHSLSHFDVFFSSFPPRGPRMLRVGSLFERRERQ